MRKKLFLNKNFILLLLLPLLLSGCIINVNKKPAVPVNFMGGMFRSADLGASWEHIVDIYNANGQALNFNTVNITTYTLDPTDQAAMYIGTEVSGILYTYNYGQAWYNTIPGPGVVNDIVVNPKDRCEIFAAIHNNIYKSTDCSRSWKSIYYDNLPNTFITDLAINANNPDIIYAGTSGGAIVRSRDHGAYWDVIYRFNNPINDIIIQNQLDSNIMYVATQNLGIFRSVTGGMESDWVNILNEKVDQAEVDEDTFVPLAQLPGAAEIIALSVDRSQPDALIYVNTYGIYRLTFGEMWKQIKMIPPKSQERVYAVVVNPANTNEIFYGTTGAFYHSIDNGANWNISKPPSTGWPNFLVFSLDNQYLYYGSYITQR